jgi:hypothetical protein
LKPDYIAKLKGDGSFSFKNLPPGVFNLFALKDGDGSKNYSNKEELFAFHPKTVSTNNNNSPISLFAFTESKPVAKAPVAATAVRKTKI